MNFCFPGAYPQQYIQLNLGGVPSSKPDYVLVFPFFHEKLLFTHHRERGWELPGGTRKAHENALQAAKREVYEETGAVLASLKPLGQYTMRTSGLKEEVKVIYVGLIQHMFPIPQGFESDEARLFSPIPSAEEVKNDPSFSLLLKDDVYKYTLPKALSALKLVSQEASHYIT